MFKFIRIVKPHFAALKPISCEAVIILSNRCLSTIDYAINVATDTLVQMYSNTCQVAFLTCPKHSLTDLDVKK